ncbi:MAG: 30S ribosomal subunit protein S1 [Candidatus Westeberhardia cardiocondylae]|nr:30S ribosomal subunit protein S1 [Candidatus Westeberhardia cardiocondylae]
MKESFSQLFENFLKNIEIRQGSIIQGTVLSIKKDIVLVDSGLKSESYIPIEQFKDNQGNIEVKVGDKIDVSLDQIEDGFGETILSRDKAKCYESWLILQKTYEEEKTIFGTIQGKVKGGFTVSINNIRAFLPGSLVDKNMREDPLLDGKEIELKIIKLDKKRSNIVVSRKAVIESCSSKERMQILEKFQEGMKVTGIIKNLTDYGAFIDLGVIDGLLHITDMSWKRIKHPNEIVNIGDEITVKILKFDLEKSRVSLGLKQLTKDPWIFVKKRYPINNKIIGKVTNITDYGCFIEIEEGIEGLVHISEMAWKNKNISPYSIVNIGDMVNVIILDIDEKRHRISLSIKQCTENPWKNFANIHQIGDYVKGTIKSVTDFGIFVDLTHGINGLVHISDISWNNIGEKIIHTKYQQGNEIKTVLLHIDTERERISLGIKQLKNDPYDYYLYKNKIGSVVDGKILSINEEKRHMLIHLQNNVHGYLYISPEDNDYQQNIKNIFFINNIIQVKLKHYNYHNQHITLSIYKNNNIDKIEKSE